MTNRHRPEATMHANDGSNINKQARRCVNFLRSKRRRPKPNETPNTQAANKNKLANEVCEYFSFQKRRSQQSDKCKERRMLMMKLTQTNRRKRCVNIPRSKKAPTNESTKPPNTQAANKNKLANEVCEYFSF